MVKNKLEKVLYRIFSFYKYREQDFQKKFYKGKYAKRIKYCGRNLVFHGKVDIVFPKGLSIGDDVQVGEDAFFDCRGGVIIGRRTFIGRNVKILSTSQDKSSAPFLDKEKLIPGAVIIGEETKIGTNVTILPGIAIGNGAVIQSGLTVREDVNEGQILFSETQPLSKGRLSNFDKKFVVNSELISPIHKQELGEGNKIVFVLSTGRSGSQSIASLGNKHLEIDAYHEPFYNFLKVISTNYSHGLISKQEVKEKLIKLYSSLRLSKKGNIYLESDQKLVPLLGILNEIFPEAKYIWLIRNPTSFLKSARARGWFDDDGPAFNENTVLLQQKFYSHGCRITGDKLSANPISDWNVKTVEDKILWYWRYWNEEIEKTFSSLPAGRKHLIKLQNLNRDQAAFFEFLNVERPKIYKPVMANKVKDRHKSKYKGLERTKNLEKQEEYFESIE